MYHLFVEILFHLECTKDDTKTPSSKSTLETRIVTGSEKEGTSLSVTSSCGTLAIMGHRIHLVRLSFPGLLKELSVSSTLSNLDQKVIAQIGNNLSDLQIHLGHSPSVIQPEQSGPNYHDPYN